MKRFIVFSGDTYYPAGGWNDMLMSADTIEEARNRLRPIKSLYCHNEMSAVFTDDNGKEEYLDWCHIVDTTTGLKVSLSDGTNE